jgi:hypothetical protein
VNESPKPNVAPPPAGLLERMLLPFRESFLTRAYALIGLIALLIVFLVLRTHAELESTYLFPVFIGLIGLLTRWTSAPPLFVWSLSAVLVAPLFSLTPRKFKIYTPGTPLQLEDIVLVAAALAYIAANYRLIALARHLFPADFYAKEKLLGPAAWLATNPAPSGSTWRRSARHQVPDELPLFFLGIVAWTLVAHVARMKLADLENPLDMPAGIWQAVVLLWLLGMWLLLTKSAVDYWRWRHLTKTEASLFLQDELWHATRGEQRFLHRWLAWAGLKRRQKEKQ